MKNPHRRVVLEMSHSTAGELLLQLDLSCKFIRAFYGEEHSLMRINRALGVCSFPPVPCSLFGGAFAPPRNLRGQRTDPCLYYLTIYHITGNTDNSCYYKGV